MKNAKFYFFFANSSTNRVLTIDAVPHLFEAKENADGSYDDEPLSGQCTDEIGYCYLNHTKTFDQDESFDLVYQWRRVIDEPEFAGSKR